MKDLRKVVPPSRVILDDIWLSFYPGAKIGVLGANGAGKSSLLRIMAGVDQEFQGEAWAHAGHAHRLPAAGAAARPDARPCAETSRRRSQRSARCSTEFERDLDGVRRADGRQGDGEAARPAGARCRSRSTRTTSGTSTTRSRSRWTRCACRPADADVTNLSGGETSSRRAVPGAARGARHAAARRADQPPRRRERRVARAITSHDVPGHRRRHHARSLLPRQRREVDPRARSRPAAFRTRATTPAGSSRSSTRLAQEEKTGVRASAHAGSASSSGCGCRRARDRRRARRASRSTRSCASDTQSRRSRRTRS